MAGNAGVKAVRSYGQQRSDLAPVESEVLLSWSWLGPMDVAFGYSKYALISYMRAPRLFG